MSWMTEIPDAAALRERALKGLSLPIGLANPLWLAFGAAASTGVAWWLMTRWARPVNAEALFGVAHARVLATQPAKLLETIGPAAPEMVPETSPVLLEVALDVAPAMMEAIVAPVEALIEMAEAETAVLPAGHSDALADAGPPAGAEALREAEAAPGTDVAFEQAPGAATAEAVDDLTRLVGVGPRTAAALMERGITRFGHLAEWTDEQLAAFDAEMKLKGRSARDAWRAQAQRLASEA